MKLTTVFVWAYIVFSVILEVYVAALMQGNASGYTAISILATSQAAAVVLFYMQLKNEPNSIRLFAIVALMFLAALLAAMIATLG
jgi:hypothetical protein